MKKELKREIERQCEIEYLKYYGTIPDPETAVPVFIVTAAIISYFNLLNENK